MEPDPQQGGRYRRDESGALIPIDEHGNDIPSQDNGEPKE